MHPPPEQMSFLTVSNENLFFQKSGHKIGCDSRTQHSSRISPGHKKKKKKQTSAFFSLFSFLWLEKISIEEGTKVFENPLKVYQTVKSENDNK